MKYRSVIFSRDPRFGNIVVFANGFRETCQSCRLFLIYFCTDDYLARQRKLMLKGQFIRIVTFLKKHVFCPS